MFPRATEDKSGILKRNVPRPSRRTAESAVGRGREAQGQRAGQSAAPWARLHFPGMLRAADTPPPPRARACSYRTDPNAPLPHTHTPFHPPPWERLPQGRSLPCTPSSPHPKPGRRGGASFPWAAPTPAECALPRAVAAPREGLELEPSFSLGHSRAQGGRIFPPTPGYQRCR